MSWIANMKIMTKLVLVFLFVSILSALVGIYAVSNMKAMNKRGIDLYAKNTLGIEKVSTIQMSFMKNRMEVRNLMVVAPEARPNIYKNIDQNFADIEKVLGEYKNVISDDKDRENYENLVNMISGFKKDVYAIVDVCKANKSNSEIIAIIAQAAQNTTAAGDMLGTMTRYNSEKAKEDSDQNTKNATDAIFVVVTLVLVSAVVSITLGVIISLAISRPINKLADAGRKLAIGDVNIDVYSTSKDEVGILTESFAKVIEAIKEQAGVIQKIADGDLTVDIKIRSEADLVNKKIEQMVAANNNIFSEIRKAAEQVNSAAGQVAQGSTMLAQASTEQSATVEEISATVEEIASQSKENASGARNANELASEARESSETGSAQMKNMMNSMNEINEASRNISKIIKVIDDIAFQTNILALNAAVEAARAGSHGKGFAVVAEEVRNLAARSAKAASETTDLIESTIAKVNAGTKIATDTAEALNIINEKIGKVTGMIEEIATSSGEQATAVAQVSLGVAQVSGAVQTNSATAEESAAASEELSAQATLLKQSVAIFKLKEGHRAYMEREEKGMKEVDDMEEFNNGYGKY